MSEPDQSPRKKRHGRMIGVGLAIGAAVGVALDNIAVGTAVGLAIGVAMDSYQKDKMANEEEDNEE